MKFRECYGKWRYVRHVKTVDLNIHVDLAKTCHILYRIYHLHVSRVQALCDVLSGGKAVTVSAYTRVIGSIMGSGDHVSVMNALRKRVVAEREVEKEEREHQMEIDWDDAWKETGL